MDLLLKKFPQQEGNYKRRNLSFRKEEGRIDRPEICIRMINYLFLHEFNKKYLMIETQIKYNFTFKTMILESGENRGI